MTNVKGGLKFCFFHPCNLCEIVKKRERVSNFAQLKLRASICCCYSLLIWPNCQWNNVWLFKRTIKWPKILGNWGRDAQGAIYWDMEKWQKDLEMNLSGSKVCHWRRLLVLILLLVSFFILSTLHYFFFSPIFSRVYFFYSLSVFLLFFFFFFCYLTLLIVISFTFTLLFFKIIINVSKLV